MHGPKSVTGTPASLCATILTLSLTAAPARAQDFPLAQLLPDLILREIVLESPAVIPWSRGFRTWRTSARCIQRTE